MSTLRVSRWYWYRDFNGLPVRQLQSRHDLDDDELKGYLRLLVNEGNIALVFGDYHPNPHIRAFPHEPEEEQIRKLETSLTVSTCAYPTKSYLGKVVDSSDYRDRPYVLELAQGEPSLSFRFFELAVLEFYRNDPRYSYYTDDISGSIGIHQEFAEGSEASLYERDQIYLQSFGFCYDKDLNRGVAVTVNYLTKLTPEHQQMWKLKELKGSYFPHPDYYGQIMGRWAERISIFDAFLEELKLVNQMSELMNRTPLFKDSFAEERPREFTFLIRPTLTEFNNFVQLLDKLMSENINKAFFSGEVEEQFETVRRDGKIQVHQKGTITLLEEWFTKVDPLI